MFDSFARKDDYNILMENLMAENKQFVKLTEDKAFKIEMTIKKANRALKTLDFKMVKNYIDEIQTQHRLKKSGINVEIVNDDKNILNNYFSNDKIAVYTCVFGKYDTIQEPLCIPDNCDYYIVTDLELPKSSIWKQLQVDEKEYGIENLSPAEKNRYFKMHPHVLFPEYNASVYIDGNIKIIADPTAFVNKIGRCGIAMHSHSRRNCVYDEIIACDIYKRESKENLKKQKELLENEKFPRQYGMCECNVIARYHNKPEVIAIMNQWWNYYLQYAKRDQLSWPLVLYKNGISINEVATLGENVGRNYAVRIVRHDIMQKM